MFLHYQISVNVAMDAVRQELHEIIAPYGG